MMAVLAAIVDAEAVVESVVAALVACVGVAIAFSLAIYGAARFAEGRREGGSPASGAGGVLAIAALSSCAAIIAVGLVIMLADRT